MQVVTRAEGRLHSLTLRNVEMTHAGFVKIMAKDFQAQATLIVNGKNLHKAVTVFYIMVVFFLIDVHYSFLSCHFT